MFFRNRANKDNKGTYRYLYILYFFMLIGIKRNRNKQNIPVYILKSCEKYKIDVLNV